LITDLATKTRTPVLAYGQIPSMGVQGSSVLQSALIEQSSSD
jgi:hypothetical protein